MYTRVSSRIVFQIFRCRLYHSSSFQEHINKTTGVYNTINYYNKQNNDTSYFCRRQFSNKILCQPFAPVCVNFKRNISNESTVNNNEGLPTFSESYFLNQEEIEKLTSNVNIETLNNISNWKIVELAQNALLQTHEITGLPWWATIALTAFVIRATVTFPLTIYQVHNAAKVQNLNAEIDDISQKVKRELNYACRYHGWPEELAKNEFNKRMKKEWNNLIVRDNCHPAKSYVVMWLQFPLWMSFSIATRNLSYMLPVPDIKAQLIHQELSKGGFGWVKNLADIDHYLILPVSVGLINLAINEIFLSQKHGPISKMEKWKCNILRLFSVLMIFIALKMPAATLVYWLSSSSFAILQICLLKSTKFRRLLKLPEANAAIPIAKKAIKIVK